MVVSDQTRGTRAWLTTKTDLRGDGSYSNTSTILVVMGNGLLLAHQDREGFNWLTKPAENPWSETIQMPPAC